MEIRQSGKHRWTIPKESVPGMRVDGLVFASRGLLEKARADKALEQVVNVAQLPGIVGHSIAMPDIHWGYGFCIGGVAATDIADAGVVSPGGVGFDIGCGVRLMRSTIAWGDAAGRIDPLADALAARVPRGVGAGGLHKLSEADMNKVLVSGVNWALGRGIGSDDDAQYCEDQGRLEGADAAAVSGHAKERGRAQLGSLGGGNHFLEVQVVEEVFDQAAAAVFGLFEGQLCVMIHTGSRGVGHQICTEEVRAFDRLGKQLGIKVPDRQLACAPWSYPEAQRYVAAMAGAANFARVNRHVLSDAVRSCFEAVFATSARDMGLDLVYDVSHNLAKTETHSVGASKRVLCVHRKGATRALGPRTEELPERYRPVGQPVLVPGSMGTSSYVLRGATRGDADSFNSTCHGAGRAMSRKQALKQMEPDHVRTQLEDQGISVRAQHRRLLSEEAPYAYKDVSEVVTVCEEAGLSHRVARLRPVAVVKG